MDYLWVVETQKSFQSLLSMVYILMIIYYTNVNGVYLLLLKNACSASSWNVAQLYNPKKDSAIIFVHLGCTLCKNIHLCLVIDVLEILFYFCHQICFYYCWLRFRFLVVCQESSIFHISIFCHYSKWIRLWEVVENTLMFDGAY